MEPIVTNGAPSIFLAGPTPRSQDVSSWRPSAIETLYCFGWNGVVFLPEDRSGVFHGDYIGQVEWEDAALQAADCITFWVPRNLWNLPGFTTNDEWGFWKASGKVTWGAPPDADKVNYQWHYAHKLNVPTADNLNDSCKNAIELASHRWLMQNDVSHALNPTYRTR